MKLTNQILLIKFEISNVISIGWLSVFLKNYVTMQDILYTHRNPILTDFSGKKLNHTFSTTNLATTLSEFLDNVKQELKISTLELFIGHEFIVGNDSNESNLSKNVNLYNIRNKPWIVMTPIEVQVEVINGDDKRYQNVTLSSTDTVLSALKRAGIYGQLFVDDKEVRYNVSLANGRLTKGKWRVRLYDDKIFQITIKTLTEKEMSFDVQEGDSVKSVMQQIQTSYDVPWDQQRLIYSGKQLEKDNTLFDYAVKNGAIIHLVLRLRGGGCDMMSFVDVSNDKIIQDYQFSKTAPDWRCASKGINLEGKCQNHSCEAYCQMVIIGIGIGVFDFVYDQNKSVCPMCKEYVQPLTCAFTGCNWRFNGLKRSKSGPPQCYAADWKKVGDVYSRFNESSEKVQWDQLQLIATHYIAGTCFKCHDSVDIGTESKETTDFLCHADCGSE